MTDPRLTELLEAAGDRTHVGPPPVAEIVAGARRRRRRTMLVTAGAAAAVIFTVGGATILAAPGINSLYPAGPAGSPSTALSDQAKPAPMEGTWTVEALVGPGGQSVLPDARKGQVVLTFADGEVTGATGCNSIFGAYEHGGEDGRDLQFPRAELGSTLVNCADEPPLLTRLLEVRHVSGSGNVRRLHAENWMIVAELRRAKGTAAAFWTVAPGQDLNAETSEIAVLVTRLGCNSGVTGGVVEPDVRPEGNRVVLTFTVRPGEPSAADCPGNNQVPYAVELPEPIGNRQLVDGQCLPEGEATGTSFCQPDGVRYSP
jgi:heat shock protein HslJ